MHTANKTGAYRRALVLEAASCILVQAPDSTAQEGCAQLPQPHVVRPDSCWRLAWLWIQGSSCLHEVWQCALCHGVAAGVMRLPPGFTQQRQSLHAAGVSDWVTLLCLLARAVCPSVSGVHLSGERLGSARSTVA